MKIMRFLIVVLAITVTNSCSQNKQEKNNFTTEEREKLEEKYREILEKHDQVMPKIDDIMNAKAALDKELERINQGVDAVGKERREAIENIIKELDFADESMMNWMRNHARKPSDTLSYEKALEYLKNSNDIINDVQNNIYHVLDSANTFIN